MAIPRSNERVFRAVGFSALVFTQEELNRLTPLTEDIEEDEHTEGNGQDHE